MKANFKRKNYYLDEKKSGAYVRFSARRPKPKPLMPL